MCIPNATASKFRLSVSFSFAFLTTSFQDPLLPRLLCRDNAERGLCLALVGLIILAEFWRECGGLDSTSNSCADALAPIFFNLYFELSGFHRKNITKHLDGLNFIHLKHR